MCQPSRRFSRKYSRHGFTSDGSSKPLTAYSWGSPVFDSCVEIAMMGCRVVRLRSCSTSSRSEAERCVHGVMETCCEFQRYRAWTQPLTTSPAQAVVMIAARGNRIDLTTQAQRPGARDATLATATFPPGSLQRMVRRIHWMKRPGNGSPTGTIPASKNGARLDQCHAN